ncbi:hypothetical protein LDL59_00030 [Kaistella anthropi]|jgi:hypothetical protein|nr:hypothetical protein [Kaistella anthropi]
MYLAQIDSKQSQIPFYISIFSDILNGENEYKNQMDTAIKDAALVSTNKKDIYSVERKHYFLITSLLMYYNDRLSKLSDVDDINDSVYTEIINLLSKNYGNDC